MSEFRFLGSETVLNGSTLVRYGQRVEMEPDQADALIADHPPAMILPGELWDKIFPPGDESELLLATWPSAAGHGWAPVEFREKAHAVRVAWHTYRENLLLPNAPAGGFGKAPAAAAAPVKEEPPPSDGHVKIEPEG